MASSKDVAKKAGVSQTTVSRVLNAPEQVRPETRDKVLAAIAALNYVPDANARSLVQQKSYSISLISGGLENPFFVDSTTEIINFATRAGYRVNVHFVGSDEVADAYDAALANKTDGLIMSCMLLDDPVVERLEHLQLPFISFNRRHREKGNYVEIDNLAAGKLAAEHLLALGHRDILWIGAYPRVSTFANRFLGYQSAMQAAKSRFGETLRSRVINFKQLDRPDVFGLLERLAQTDTMPSAICAATDAMAIDVLDALAALDCPVPEQVSVIGIDNVRLSGSRLIELSTVGCAKGQILGFTAVQALFAMIEAKEDGRQLPEIRITEPVSLYERRTTRALL